MDSHRLNQVNWKIETHRMKRCYACGSRGVQLYGNLKDFWFGVPGGWQFLKCPNTKCGLLWLERMPAENELHKLYKAYYTHEEKNNEPSQGLKILYHKAMAGYFATKYNYHVDKTTGLQRLAGTLFALFPGFRSDFDANVFYLDGKNRGRLLEVGCGNGIMLQKLVRLGWDATGVDIDPEGVAVAQSQGLAAICGKLENIKYSPDTFDAIVMGHVIEHVNSPILLLRECMRVLKPNGALVLITPNSMSWGHDLFKEHWRGLEPPRHLFVYNKSVLSSLIKRAGFRKIVCYTKPRARNIILDSFRSKKKQKRKAYPEKRLFIWAVLLEIIESIIMLFDKNKGEELILIAHK